MLKPFRGHEVPEESRRTVDIVAIQSFGLSHSSEWVDADGVSWLHKLAIDTTPDAAIWEFEYSSSRGQPFAQFLLDEGGSLLKAVNNHCEAAQRKLPLIFVCHGTAGFVLKKALCICRDQPLSYRPVIDVVSGVIFLGAPHLGSDQAESKKTFDLLLTCRNKGFGRSRSSLSDIAELIQVCKSFETVNLRIPVISAYEEKETPTQNPLFVKLLSKSRNQVIVPESMGVLHVSTETVIGCYLDHFEICRVLPQRELYQACIKLVMEVLEAAPRRIAETSKPYKIPAGLKDDTLESVTSMGQTVVEEGVKQALSVPISYPPGGATGGSTEGDFEIIPAETALEMTVRDPRLPCYSLGIHRQMEHFVGRESEFDTIDHYLLPRSTNAIPEPSSHDDSALSSEEQLRSFAICGLGGMGKTELAAQYAYSRKDQFEAIFWLAADDAMILASNFAQIAEKLNLEEDTSDLAASRDVVMGWLSRPLRKVAEPDEPHNIVNWLLIFDNVDNLDVLSDYWPKFGNGSVLVTSRDRFAKHNIYMNNGMDLNPLSAPETETLMQRLTHVKADVGQQRALAEMANKLGGLPLAIRQMSGIFRQLRLLSYTEFIKYYNEEGIERLLSQHTGSSENPTIQSLATVWSLDRLSKNTKALLQVICVLDPDNIPEDLLVDKNGEVRMEGYPKSTYEYLTARSELVSSSLVNQNPDQNKLSLHRLIQESVRARLSKGDLIATYEAAISLVISTWPFQSIEEHHSIARFSTCESIFPSILRIKDGIMTLLQDRDDFPFDIHLARLFNDTGWYMFERGLPEETKPFCELALSIGERLQGPLGSAALDSIRESHSFLGIALVETNEHNLSTVHKKKWLDSLEERKSENNQLVEDYELGYAYNEIGVAYGNENMLVEAAAAFRRSIEIFQSLDNYEDTWLGWPEPNLGFIYWMQGRLDDAEHALVEILDIHAAAWGVDDTKSFKTGKILYGLGNVLESQGRFDESLNFHVRCFEQFKKVLGVNHHRVGDICHRLASHRIRQGMYKEAEEYLNSALKIFNSRVYLSNERSRTMFKKGKLYQLMGREAEANALLSEAYRLRKQLRPEDDRLLEDLLEADFDQLVAFWSR